MVPTWQFCRPGFAALLVEIALGIASWLCYEGVYNQLLLSPRFTEILAHSGGVD